MEYSAPLLRSLFVLAVLVTSCTSCSLPDSKALPAWLEAKVKRDEYLEVWLFQHKGQPAYFLVPSGDHGNDTVYRASGEYICSPSGYDVSDEADICPPTALADPDTKIILVWPDSEAPGEKFTVPPLHIPPKYSHDPIDSI